jgi:mannose-6-phosphate isomerase-like protein (cupin superfamily)
MLEWNRAGRVKMRKPTKRLWLASILGAVVCLSVTLGAVNVGVAQTHRPVVENIDSLLSIYYLGDDAQMRSDKIAEDSLQSIHLHQIRAGLDSHRHLHHSETVWIIRGAGRLTIGDEKHKVSAGTIITIPAGTSHSFYSLGKTPAVAISVFSPAFDGKDRIYDNATGR